jgi:hypothetical protein
MDQQFIQYQYYAITQKEKNKQMSLRLSQNSTTAPIAQTIVCQKHEERAK